MKITRSVKTAVCCMIVLSLAFAPLAYARPSDKGMMKWFKELKGHKEKVMVDIMDKLDLTETQKQELEKQREEQEQATEKAVIKLEARMASLREVLEEDKVDRGKVNELVAQINEIKGEMFRRRIDSILAMKEILTPEQYASLQDQMDKKRKSFREKWGHRKKGHGKWGHKGPEHEDEGPDDEIDH